MIFKRKIAVTVPFYTSKMHTECSKTVFLIKGFAAKQPTFKKCFKGFRREQHLLRFAPAKRRIFEYFFSRKPGKFRVLSGKTERERV